MTLMTEYAEIPIGGDDDLAQFEGSIGPEVLNTLLELASNSHRELLSDLKVSIEQGDSSKIKMTAHTIKGSAGSMFGIRISKLAENIEQNAEEFEQLRNILPQIEKTFHDTIAWWDAKKS